MNIKVYEQHDKDTWDKTVCASRNGTFLFLRDFMDYHKDRFEDISLLITDEKQRCIGLLPANAKGDCVETHGGLTYGGLLTTEKGNTLSVGEMLKAVAHHYLDAGYRTMTYKPVPHIYHVHPAEEDLYWLFRSDARLVGRSISSCIDLTAPLPFSTLRQRKAHKAERLGIRITEEHTAEVLSAYWELLSEVLQTHHSTKPVHTSDEMSRLMRAFPKNIRLYTARSADETNGLLAGCVLFLTKRVCHVQYIAAGAEGRENGALDLLFERLIRHEFAHQKYFDFGISTENGGRFLNEGLSFQKDGFGGRGICYDTYLIDLERLALL